MATQLAKAPTAAKAPSSLTPAAAKWLRGHLAWERTMQDCVERALDAKLDDQGLEGQDVATGDQSTAGTSAHSRSSS
jgi:hypothetical protein